jgi:hypothetical protein
MSDTKDLTGDLMMEAEPVTEFINSLFDGENFRPEDIRAWCRRGTLPQCKTRSQDCLQQGATPSALHASTGRWCRSHDACAKTRDRNAGNAWPAVWEIPMNKLLQYELRRIPWESGEVYRLVTSIRGQKWYITRTCSAT